MYTQTYGAPGRGVGVRKTYKKNKPQAGYDPPAQSDISYEADALPPSHHGLTDTRFFVKQNCFVLINYLLKIKLIFFRGKKRITEKTPNNFCYD